jgi:hypothetical protein
MKEIEEPELIFILGSPRTGSTLLYQILINALQPFYFSNLINDYFSDCPIIGATIQNSFPRKSIPYKSKYGKTNGLLGPSEASHIMREWFGGEHPSQTKSCTVIPNKKQHLIATLQAIYKLTNSPILIKNAWNCFRIENLQQLFPNSKFIWIRRDISCSAQSDLNSRINRGSPYIWNSATTHNYKEIQRLPYWEQVVEQQYEYNKAISQNIQSTNFVEVWYEDMCQGQTVQLEKFLNVEKLPTFNVSKPEIDDRIASYAKKFKEYKYVSM